MPVTHWVRVDGKSQLEPKGCFILILDYKCVLAGWQEYCHLIALNLIPFPSSFQGGAIEVYNHPRTIRIISDIDYETLPLWGWNELKSLWNPSLFPSL